MALVAKTPASLVSALGLFVATCIPLVYGMLCAAPYPELGSALQLIIGSSGDSALALSEPATLLTTLLTTLIPLGSLALRVALASALAAALYMHMLYRSIDTLLRAQGVSHDALVAPVALGLCLFVFGMPALFDPACKPGAFALQGALGMLVLSRLSVLEARWPSHDLRPLYSAALGFGLCVTNDLRSALLLLPAALPTLLRVQGAKGPEPLLRAGGLALAAAVGVEAVLLGRHGLQASALPISQLVTSGSGGPAPLVLLARFSQELGLFALFCGLGAVAALQTPGVRRIAMLWIGACLPPLAAYGLLAHAPTRAQGLGMIAYVLPASAVLAAALPGALLAPDGRSKLRPSRAQYIAVLCLLLLGVLRTQKSALHERNTSLPFVDTLSGLGRYLLPNRALVLVRDPRNALPLMAAEAEDRVRPDLHILPTAVLDHPQSGSALLDQQPQLRPLLRSYLLDGTLATAELESLSTRQPLLLDMDPSAPPELYGILRPRHLFYEVAGSAGMQTEERAAGAAYRDAIGALRAEASEHADADAEPAKQLLARHALAGAFYFAAAGDRENARFSIDEGRALAPTLPLWDAVSTALGPQSARGPADVHSLVPERAADLAFGAL